MMQPANRKLVVIESPFKGDVPKNKALLNNALRYATFAGFNPYASHGFFTHFLLDTRPEERKLGMELGLQWALNAEQVWFFQRDGEPFSEGMRLAHVWWKSHKDRERRLRYFVAFDNGRSFQERTYDHIRSDSHEDLVRET